MSWLSILTPKLRDVLTLNEERYIRLRNMWAIIVTRWSEVVISNLWRVRHTRKKNFCSSNFRSKWLRGLRRGFVAACLLEMWVRIPPAAWMFVSCKYCVLSGKGLCVGLITRTEESYRELCIQWVWSRSPIRGGHNPGPNRRTTEKLKRQCSYSLFVLTEHT